MYIKSLTLKFQTDHRTGTDSYIIRQIRHIQNLRSRLHHEIRTFYAHQLPEITLTYLEARMKRQQELHLQ